MHEINKLMDEIKSVQHRLDELEKPKDVDVIVKIANEMANNLCPPYECPIDEDCPRQGGATICIEHWVNYLQRVVEK